jgi:hypothetical protein
VILATSSAVIFAGLYLGYLTATHDEVALAERVVTGALAAVIVWMGVWMGRAK